MSVRSSAHEVDFPVAQLDAPHLQICLGWNGRLGERGPGRSAATAAGNRSIGGGLHALNFDATAGDYYKHANDEILVILQTEQFASNASENRGGQSWVVQRWTLDVYAQRAGDFSIPPIALQVQVSAGEAGEVAGRLDTPPVQFTAQVPELLAQSENWVAAPDFRVRQGFDRVVELFEGDHEKVLELDRRVTRAMGFERTFAEHPDVRYVSFSQEDNYDACACGPCAGIRRCAR